MVEKHRPSVSNGRARIYQIFVSVDPALVTKALKDGGNSCGHGKISSIPQPRGVTSIEGSEVRVVEHH